MDPKILSNIRLIAGRSNLELSNLISEKLSVPLTKVKFNDFGNTEIGPIIEESVRGYHVYIIQTGGCYENRSINDHVMELITLINACKLADAKTINIIMPCFAYARSDKKDVPRVAIMGACITSMLIFFGAKRIIAMDLHAGQIQGFSAVPFDNLYGIVKLLPNLKNIIFAGLSLEEINTNFVLASPDVGGVKRVEAYAKKLGIKHVIMHKHRDYDKVNLVLKTILVGDRDVVKNKTVIIIDDIMDTLGTMVSAADELKLHGAKDVILVATHGVFSGPAFDRLNACDMIKKVIVTNTLPQEKNKEKTNKLQVIDTSDLFATVIYTIRTKGSISGLFK